MLAKQTTIEHRWILNPACRRRAIEAIEREGVRAWFAGGPGVKPAIVIEHPGKTDLRREKYLADVGTAAGAPALWEKIVAERARKP